MAREGAGHVLRTELIWPCALRGEKFAGFTAYARPSETQVRRRREWARGVCDIPDPDTSILVRDLTLIWSQQFTF